MIYTLILLSIAVAGVAMLWGRLLKDSLWLQRNLQKKIPGVFYHALECPFCFTFWAALFACLLFDPIPQILSLRITLPSQIVSVLYILLSWMTTGVVALGIRTLTEYPFRIGNILLCILKKHPLHHHEETHTNQKTKAL